MTSVVLRMCDPDMTWLRRAAGCEHSPVARGPAQSTGADLRTDRLRRYSPVSGIPAADCTPSHTALPAVRQFQRLHWWRMP